MINLGLIWRTVRHLTGHQIVYQVIFRLRGRARLHRPAIQPQAYLLATPEPGKAQSYQSGVVTFLNQSLQLTSELDWNYARFGKLWTYNLSYFDYLNQPDMTVKTGLELIRDFMAQTDSLRDGLESYPTSLRIMNWVQFLSRHQVQDESINQHLFAQVRLLSHRLEYHLAGNHLLENGLALLIGALYFRRRRWFYKANRLIRQELTSQILSDGGHDERSPMYHQLLLDRLLDLLLVLQTQNWHNDVDLLNLLTEKTTQMLGWLNGITFSNGDIPMVNDAVSGIAPTRSQLRKKAETIGISQRRQPLPLTSSGYRMFRQKRYELFADAGPLGPDHQLGHAHADTFSFVLYVDNQPAIVDNSVSTYQPGIRRAWERSTVAHNTVTVNEQNSSEVWASFRVGRRARVTLVTDTETKLTARHDGYGPLGIIHERSWVVEPNRLFITDSLLNARTGDASGQWGIARFYFHPDVPIQAVDNCILAGSLKITLRSETNPTFGVISYTMAAGFNQLRSGHCLEVAFITRLETTLRLSE